MTAPTRRVRVPGKRSNGSGPLTRNTRCSARVAAARSLAAALGDGPGGPGRPGPPAAPRAGTDHAPAATAMPTTATASSRPGLARRDIAGSLAGMGRDGWAGLAVTSSQRHREGCEGPGVVADGGAVAWLWTRHAEQVALRGAARVRGAPAAPSRGRSRLPPAWWSCSCSRWSVCCNRLRRSHRPLGRTPRSASRRRRPPARARS